jgi:hypothetical protein
LEGLMNNPCRMASYEEQIDAGHDPYTANIGDLIEAVERCTHPINS